MDFNEKLKLTGHLEVIKIDNKTGEETVLFDDHNVITSGLGQSIAQFMTASGCYNLTPSTSSCLPDFQRYGPRPSIVPEGTENQLRESADWSESFTAAATREDEDSKSENCCFGRLLIVGRFTFATASPTTQTYTGTIEVTTTSWCSDYSCGERCDDYVTWSKDNGGGPVYDSGVFDVSTGVASTEMLRFINLGCCEEPSCPASVNTETYNMTGTVLGASPDDALGSLSRRIDDNYGMSADVVAPTFKECCEREKGAPRSSTATGVNN